ncbi:MAG: sigma-70 family RNA polymerase sigma factor [Rhodothermales bacterium]
MQHTDQATVTRLLDAIRAGNHDALNALFPLVYQEMRAQAQAQRRRWHGNHTVNTTALVHEAYLKLIDQTQIRWNSRAHFLGVAAKAMRHILIDYARQRQRKKRGGGQPHVPFDDVEGRLADPGAFSLSEERATALVALDAALERLHGLNERQSRIVECRFFGGMTIPDTTEFLGLSPATVKRDWRLAQTWLYREMMQALQD